MVSWEKIKMNVPEVIFNHWMSEKTTDEQRLKAKKQLKFELENIECSSYLKDMNIYEYYLLCTLLRCPDDLDYEKIKEMRTY